MNKKVISFIWHIFARLVKLHPVIVELQMQTIDAQNGGNVFRDFVIHPIISQREIVTSERLRFQMQSHE